MEACDVSSNGLTSMAHRFSIYYLHTVELIDYITKFILCLDLSKYRLKRNADSSINS